MAADEGNNYEAVVTPTRDAEIPIPAEYTAIEARLRDIEARFANFMQYLPGLAWIKDSDGRYIYVNEAAEKAFGKKRDDLYGRTDHEIFNRSVADAFVQNDRIASADGHLQTVEILDDQQGVTRHSIVNKFAIPINGAEAPLVGGIAIEITDQKRAREDQEFLFSISEAIRVCREPDKLLADISVALGKYLGLHRCLFNEIDIEHDTETVRSDYSRNGVSIAGRHRMSIYSPVASASMGSGKTVVNHDSKIDPRTADLYENTYELSNERSYIAVPMLRNGNWAASLWCSDDRPRTWTGREIALVENIAERAWSAAERLRSEALSRRSQEMLSTLVESAPFGVYSIDSEFRLISINTGARAVFSGIDPLIGRDFAEVLRLIWPEPFATEAIERFRHTLVTGESYVAPTVTEYRFGRDFTETYDWQIHRITLADGSFGVVCYFYDLTHQKKLEAEVHRTAAMDAYRVKLTDALRPLADPREIQFVAACVLGEYLSADRVGYAEDSGDGHTISVTRTFAKGLPPMEGSYPYDDQWAEVWSQLRSGKTIVFSDTKSETSINELQKGRFADLQIRATAISPLVKEGRLVAVLFIHYREVHEWSRDEIALLDETAERTWAAVEWARALHRERELNMQAVAATAKFESVFNQSSIFASIVGRDGTLIESNDLSLDACGYDRSEVIGKHLAETPWWHGSDVVRERVRTAIQQAASGKTYREVLRYWWADGSEHFVDFAIHPIRGGDDSVIFLHTTGIDISARVEAENALRVKEAELETIINATPFLLTRCGRDLKYKYVSTAYAEMVGRPPDEITGRSIRDVLGPESFETIKPYIEKVLSGEVVQYESTLAFPSVGNREITVTYSPDLAENGEVIGWIASIVDITARIEAEKAMRDSEERFRLATEAVQAVIYDWNISDDLIERSGEVERLLGFDPSDPELKRNAWWRDRIHPDDRRKTLELVERAIASTDKRFEDEYRVRLKNGNYIWVRDVGKFIRDEKGRVLRCVGSVTDITERKRAEEALHESRERLRLAQYAGNIGVWDWDVETNLTYWSETMWKIYGEKETSVNPDDTFWGRHLHEEDHDRVKSRLRELLASGESAYRDEYRIRFERDQIRWIEAIATIVRNDDGRAVRMYGVNIDITDRKLAEERTVRSKNQLRLVTDSLPALIAYVDRDLRYRFVNQRYADWFGLDVEKILGKKVREVIGPHAFNVVKPSLTAALDGEAVSIQTTLNYSQVGKRFVQVNYLPDISEDSSVRGLFSLVNDLTDWKDSQDLLHSSEQRLAMMMESVTDYAIFSMDPHGTIETWNIGAMNIFGFSAKEVIGRSSYRFFPDEKAAEAEMRAARRRGKASDERWLVRKDGTKFYASGVMMPIRVGKKLIGYVKIISDLTEKKRHAEMLQSAHDELEGRVRDRTRDLAEVNEALKKEIVERERSEAVKIGLLRRIVSAQETERQRIARDIHDQLGQRLTALRLKLAALRSICGNENGEVPRVERLQEIARLLDSEVSFLASELRPNTLDDLGLEAALSAYAADWSRHYDLKLEFHANVPAPQSLGREAEIQLYRIAQEALNNIAKHANATQVDLLLERTADSLVLIVEDNGVGFDQKNANKKRDRLGMGLVGMNERASLIGAAIEVESEEGKGTTIFVRLPLTNIMEEE